MLKRVSTPLTALAVAALIVTSVGTGAVAQRLIGTKDVADNSLTGKDIKDRSLTGKDVKDGSLTAADIKGGLPTGATGPAGPQGVRGLQGVQGHQGPRGEAGPPGSAGPDEVVRWDVTYTSDDVARGDTVVATSSQLIAKFTELKPIAFEIDGDFGGCRYPYVYLERGDQHLAGAEGNNLSYVSTTTAVALEDGPLTLRAYCADQSADHLPIPSFTASVVFHATHLDSVATRRFN